MAIRGDSSDIQDPSQQPGKGGMLTGFLSNIMGGKKGSSSSSDDTDFQADPSSNAPDMSSQFSSNNYGQGGSSYGLDDMTRRYQNSLGSFNYDDLSIPGAPSGGVKDGSTKIQAPDKQTGNTGLLGNIISLL